MTAQAEKKKRSSYQVHVDADVCDGCGICIFFCKPVVFQLSPELSRRGVFPAVPVAAGACNNCRLCELACPQLAIAVLSDSEGEEADGGDGAPGEGEGGEP